MQSGRYSEYGYNCINGVYAMTPQELMDLPYAGDAEKQLRRLNMWHLTEKEKLDRAKDNIAGNITDAIDQLQEALDAI